VNTDVDASIEQRLVELAGEETLASDVGEGLVENLVTGGLKRDGRIERDRRCQVKFREVSMGTWTGAAPEAGQGKSWGVRLIER